MTCNLAEFCSNATKECWDKLDRNSCDKYSYKGGSDIFDKIERHKARFGHRRR